MRNHRLLRLDHISYCTAEAYAGIAERQLPQPENILLPPTEALATVAPDEAASGQTGADVQARIARERAMWENARAVLAKARTVEKAMEAANNSY